MTDAATTIIVGIGNPTLGDDGVGVVVANRLAVRLAHCPGVTVRECPVGGLRLAELLVGHRQAFIVDAMAPAVDSPPGSIHRLDVADCVNTWHASCAHDTNLPLALRTLAEVGEPLPGVITIIAIAAEHMDTFTEDLTPAVAAAAIRVEDEIAEHCSKGMTP